MADRATNSRGDQYCWRWPLWRPSAGWPPASSGGKARHAQSYLTEQLTAAERARESLASDLQNLEKAGRAPLPT